MATDAPESLQAVRNRLPFKKNVSEHGKSGQPGFYRAPLARIAVDAKPMTVLLFPTAVH